MASSATDFYLQLSFDICFIEQNTKQKNSYFLQIKTMSQESDETDDDIGQQIRVKFILDASVTNRELEVPHEPIAVPSDVRRKGLSAVINHLLGRRIGEIDQEDDDEKDAALPFDFIIHGKLLRSGVESAARRYGLSLEQAVPLTYFPAQEAPHQSGKGEPIPDWIGCIQYRDKLVATGGYDGSIRLYTLAGDILETVATTQAHSGPIKCMAVSAQESGFLIASGSLDQSLVVHAFNEETNSLDLCATFTDGHTSSIGCVGISSQQMVSGDWDGGLSIWSLDASAAVEEQIQIPSAKKAKSSNGTTLPHTTKTVKPRCTFAGHGSQISGIAWNPFHDNTFVTCSWDHSVKVWDAEKQNCLLTLNGSRVVTCMDLSTHSQVLATGHPDCTVRLWDVRTKDSESASLVSDSSLKPSHKAWVSAVQWSPKDPFILASSSHDGSLKIWDIRCTLPLHTVRTHPKEEKALCLAYGDGGLIYTGGTDCIVKQYQC